MPGQAGGAKKSVRQKLNLLFERGNFAGKNVLLVD